LGPGPAIDFSRTALPARLRPSADLGVLDITKYFGEATGGIRTYLLEKARFVESNPRLRQVLVVPGADDSIAQTSGVRCYRLRGPRIPTQDTYRFLLATRSTRRIIEHERPHLIEVGSPFLVPWLTRRANRALGAPMVWFYHTNFPSIIDHSLEHGVVARGLREAAWSYIRRLAGLFRAVLAASETVARQLEARVGTPVHRVGLGVDLECFHPRRRPVAETTRRTAGLPPGPLALFVGRIAREKRIDILLDAWPAVERRTGATLVLVGDGPVRDRLRGRASGRRMVWLPYETDRTRLADLMAAADLYVAPGPAETFGLAALEALASGTPVLSVDQGGVAELVSRSGAGRLYPRDDSAALAETAIALLQGDLAALGVRGRAHAVAYHSWPAVFERIFEVYRRLLG
jgi:alpha-1,6-mannosyltransferase